MPRTITADVDIETDRHATRSSTVRVASLHAAQTAALSIFAMLMVVLSGCEKSTDQAIPKNALTPGDRTAQMRMETDVAVLAADNMRGREAGAPGYDAAAAYVATRMAAVGLQPGVVVDGAPDGWRQSVPMAAITRRPEEGRLTINPGPDEIQLTYGEDFLPSAPAIVGGGVAAATGAVVYVGYGIDDPGDRRPNGRWNDYAGLDVAGKIVVMIGGAPDRFQSEERAYLSSPTVKLKTAARHGAVGALFLRSPNAEKRASWDRVMQHADSVAMRWTAADGTPNNPGKINAVATLSRVGAQKLFAGAAHTFDAMYSSLENGEPLPSPFTLDATVSIAAASAVTPVNSANIVGFLPGADPDLRDEAIVLSAHLDHVGADCADASEPTPDDEQSSQSDTPMDCIHNGAMDNALGVASMLEAARAMALGPLPARSVYFVALTAEEKGLVGADYFTTHPPLGDRKIVANVNLDMPLVLFPFTDVIAFGADRSTLGGIVGKAAGAMDVQLSPDPIPEQGLFTRSDHFRFVEKGIPSVFLFIGFSDGGEEIFEDFIRTHYHRPTDDINQPIDWRSAERFAALNTRIAIEIANSETTPAWIEGDFFGDLFARP